MALLPPVIYAPARARHSQPTHAAAFIKAIPPVARIIDDVPQIRRAYRRAA